MLKVLTIFFLVLNFAVLRNVNTDVLFTAHNSQEAAVSEINLPTISDIESECLMEVDDLEVLVKVTDLKDLEVIASSESGLHLALRDDHFSPSLFRPPERS